MAVTIRTKSIIKMQEKGVNYDFTFVPGTRIHVVINHLLNFVQHRPEPDHQPVYCLTRHLYRQQSFSVKAFGPGNRPKAVIDHIKKELVEIAADPTDVEEWIDVVMLALDGAWRAGYSPEEVSAALEAKLAKNEKRDWPDWRTADPDKAIEHIREAG